MFPFLALSGRTVSVSTISGGTATRSSGAGATISLTLNTDGTASVTGTVFTTVNYNWCSPTTTGIGASYWVKYTETITLNNGSGGGITTGSTGVVALTSARVYTVTSDVLTNQITSSLLIQIYTNSAGTELVSSTTINLSASRA